MKNIKIVFRIDVKQNKIVTPQNSRIYLFILHELDIVSYYRVSFMYRCVYYIYVEYSLYFIIYHIPTKYVKIEKKGTAECNFEVLVFYWKSRLITELLYG